MMISRRSVIAGSLAGSVLVAAPALIRAQVPFAAYPFTLGVAAGDPAGDGFVIWTRLAPQPLDPHGGMPMAPVPVDWEVASDDRFRTIVAKGTEPARPELAHSVHVAVGGLQPGRPYWYRFRCGAERSAPGMARTLPAPGAAVDRVRFGVLGCQHYEDGFFTAYAHAAAENLDFVFHYGDYIYENRASPIRFGYDGQPRPFVRAHAGQEPFSLDDYRIRYAQYRQDADLQAAHAACAWFPTYDDHEVENNWAADMSEDGIPPEVFRLRRTAAWQAWYEHMPVRAALLPDGNVEHMNRRATVGNLLDLHLLDTRQFRSDQPCGDGFKPVCPAVADPKATMLGAAQEQWLASNMAQRAARWNGIAQQVMMMPLDRQVPGTPGVRNMDSWAGYDAPRERLFGRFAAYDNVVVLTGDEHQTYAGELRTDAGRGNVVAVEFVATSISSGGDGADRRPGIDKIEAANPFLKYTNDRRGYAVCEVTPQAWTTKVRTVDFVSRPGAPVRTAQTITVAHGSRALALG